MAMRASTAPVAKMAAKIEEKIAENKQSAVAQTAEKAVKVPEKVTPEKAASEKFAPEKVAPEKAASEKFAPEKVAPEKVAPEKVAHEKAAPEKVVPEKDTSERAAAKTVSPEMAAPKKSVDENKSEPIADKPSTPVRKERTVEGDTLGAPVSVQNEAVAKAPMSEERANSDFGATTKDLPEFVTIKRVIRRIKADGTEEIVTKRVRERPTAIRPNGDVVVQRTVRRRRMMGPGRRRRWSSRR